jgi:hypothetical protein
MTPSLVQIFEVSDVRAQELIVGLLRRVSDLMVTAASHGPDLLVNTACVDEGQARSVFRLVTSIDFDARLVHATAGPTQRLVVA